MRYTVSILFLSIGITAFAGGVNFQQDIETVVKQGRGAPEGRKAWDRLSQADASVLPALLEGMNTKETVAANWLRLAVDRIVERELKVGGKAIDSAKVLAFVKDPAKHGRARRYALDLLDQLTPGTSEKLFPDWLDDPEFRYDAVARILTMAKGISRATVYEQLHRTAFEKTRDLEQARKAAAALDGKVSIGEQFGFLMDWHLIGPFDGKKQKGFHLSYSPEKKVDLKEELDGQAGKVRWVRYKVDEKQSSGNRHALVNLREKRALGDADDAVAYAYTEFTVEKAMQAEMRGAADDNLTVWLNGEKVFAFEEWRNGVRHDRHIFAVKLKEGKNTVLVKVCQSMAPNPEPNWEFCLRVVDATGKGIAMK